MLYYKYSKGKLKIKKKKGIDTMISITVETINYNANELQEKARKAKYEYEWARSHIMCEIRKFLDRNTGKSFTAKELSKAFGLSARVIARESYYYGINSRPRVEYVKFVELLPDGESVNYNNEITQRIKCNEYYR